MKIQGVMVIVCALAGTVLADPIEYAFDVTGGSLTLEIRQNYLMPDVDLTLSTTAGGTFATTIYQSDGHIGESDTFTLEDADLYNAEEVIANWGLIIVTIPAGSARLLDFMPDDDGHIGSCGQATVSSNAYLSVTAFITGPISTTYNEARWADVSIPFDMTFSTSVCSSDVLNVTLSGTYHHVFWYGAITPGSIDFIFDIQGTAHVVPDPALCGLVAMGLGGAGAWLKRRRS